MTFQQMKCISAVVKYGSFSLAAEKLYLSQPMVSKHIQSLEQEIGFPLLDRSSKSIALT